MSSRMNWFTKHFQLNKEARTHARRKHSHGYYLLLFAALDWTKQIGKKGVRYTDSATGGRDAWNR